MGILTKHSEFRIYFRMNHSGHKASQPTDTAFSNFELGVASLPSMSSPVMFPLHDESCSFCGDPIDRQGYNDDGTGPHDCPAKPRHHQLSHPSGRGAQRFDAPARTLFYQDKVTTDDRRMDTRAV
jgi:hypothetical protein